MFTTVVDAIREGRRTFYNVQLYLGFYLGVTIVEVSTYSAALLIGLPFALDGFQNAFIAFAARHIPNFFLIFHPPAKDIMSAEPRRPDAPILSRAYVKWVLIPFALASSLVMVAFIAASTWMHTGFYLNNDIVGSAQFEAVKNNVAACEYAGQIVEGIGYVEDNAPFHCRCAIRTAPWASPTKFKGSIGEGSNHSNFSGRSSVRIL